MNNFTRVRGVSSNQNVLMADSKLICSINLPELGQRWGGGWQRLLVNRQHAVGLNSPIGWWFMIFIWMILMTFTSHMAPLMTTKMIMNSNGNDDNENDDDGKLSLTITSHLALIIQKYYDDMNMKMMTMIMTMKMKILRVGKSPHTLLWACKNGHRSVRQSPAAANVNVNIVIIILLIVITILIIIVVIFCHQHVRGFSPPAPAPHPHPPSHHLHPPLHHHHCSPLPVLCRHCFSPQCVSLEQLPDRLDWGNW